MFRHIFTVILSIVLVASTALADGMVVGHPTPLSRELLESPVTLDCGATVRESRGSVQDYKHLNDMCTHAALNFFKYINARNLKAQNDLPFTWNISFLPIDNGYRSLNDEEFRFNNRFIGGRVIGYTDRNDRYAYMSSVHDREFDTTFVHEMFHAMSMHYGVYDNHPGTWMEKTEADERCAQEFTEWLGYGR